MDLDSMKYAELRSLAKELGLKANMKADKLLKAIKQYYREAEQEREQDDDNVSGDENVAPENPKEESCGTSVFVNTRRGKRNGTKRKVSDGSVSDSEAKTSPKAAEVGGEACSKPSKARTAKKRKVSSDKVSRQTSEDSGEEQQSVDIERQQQPDVKDEAPLPENFESDKCICGLEKAPRVSKAGKIPRYQGLQQKNKALKPTTPNFKKLHEAQFNKMESIDTYVQRKAKQVGSLKNPVKELKKATRACATLFSPVVNKSLAEEKRRHTLMSASKAAAAGKDVSFRPSVLSTRRINVRFSEATRDNEFKRSLVKTPARMSPFLTSSTPQKQAAGAEKPNGIKTSVFSAQKTPVPFVFSANTSTSATPGTQKKPSFDLKASLSRPLTWKPHKGKLKPFGETNENTVENKSQISNTRQETYKQHKVQSRDERRAKKVEDRKQKKENMLGARRGLVMM
ncbi:LOW QUALITY PROTEIN: nucleolar and spindle-associated protein 1 [Xenentodon cancila]